MPKLIDYPRTSYTGAWEVAEVVDDTGGKCALETCARKLNRKVSGSFKAIIGSAVKFGLLTSKREMLATTTLFRRIKHAYDKQEELVFHREAFLTPPLFSQLCRKFRSRELPVAMLDVLLIREFGVEEINAQGVAKAFIDGAHLVNLLDENNVVADIDQLAAQQGPRREISSPPPAPNVFRQLPTPTADPDETDREPDETSDTNNDQNNEPTTLDPVTRTVTTASVSAGASRNQAFPPTRPAPPTTVDAIAHLFGFNAPPDSPQVATDLQTPLGRNGAAADNRSLTSEPIVKPATQPQVPASSTAANTNLLFRIQLAGPGINTQLDVTEVEDLNLIRALLDKIERQLRK